MPSMAGQDVFDYLAWYTSEICTYMFDDTGELLAVDSQFFPDGTRRFWNLDKYKDLYWIPHVSTICCLPPNPISTLMTNGEYDMPWITCVVVQKKHPDKPELYPAIDSDNFATIGDKPFPTIGYKQFIHSVLVTSGVKELFDSLGKESIVLPCKDGEVEVSLEGASTIISTLITDENKVTLRMK